MEQENETSTNSVPAMPYAGEPEFKEIGSDAQLTELYVALGMARAEFGAVEKNRVSGKGTNKEFAYADLDASLSATVKALASNGLVVLQPLTMRGGLATLRTILAHKGGGRLVAMFDVPLPLDGDVQTFGKNVTYSRKYQYNALVCIAADQDLDEAGDSQQSFRGQSGPKASTAQSSGQASSATSSQPRASSTPANASSSSAQSQASDEGPRRLNQTEKAELTKLVREIHGLDPADLEGVKCAVNDAISGYVTQANKPAGYVVNVNDYKPLHALLFARAVKAKQDRSAEGPQS